MRIGALESGGTKMVMGIYDGDGRELERASIPTLAPEETMPRIKEFFGIRGISALGIASFGPLCLNKKSTEYGYITATPKLAWRNYPLLPELEQFLNVPCLIDTDVNAAAIAERETGAAVGLDDVVYVTVGTGIGGGIIINGKPVHGLMHPEIGHMLMRQHPADPSPRGVCPYHVGCLEGLAAGPGLAARAGRDARELDDDDPVFETEAHYLAQMCVNLILTACPKRIIIGGGVMARTALYGMIQKETARLLGGYVQVDEITRDIESYIVAPELYPVSGLVGAFLLGRAALAEAR